MSEHEVELTEKLRSEGFDLENCSTAEKVLYVWKLYLASEDELKGVLEQLEVAKGQHAAEMQEIEAYVEQIKTLSDERESLTLEFEKENDVLRGEMEKEQIEVSEMLSQQGLNDVISSPVPEQVAFLLVERAKLLDALENELSSKMVNKEADMVISADISEGHNSESNTKAETDLNDQPSSCSDSESTRDHTDNEELSVHSQTEAWEGECNNCRRLQRERNELSSKYIIADEQVKSLERRVGRFKVLLGEDVVHKEDVIGTFEEDVESYKKQLAQKSEELKASAAELIQVQKILNSMNEKYESYEQNCQPFDSTQTSFSATQTSFGTTFSQPDDKLAELIEEKDLEIETLRNELLEVAEKSSADLEQTILNYEQKLEDFTEKLNDESNKQVMSPSDSSRLKELQDKISSLESEKAELEKILANQESEISTYQNELEQVLANQEEELERNEQLQKELDCVKDKAAKADVDGVLEENGTLQEQYVSLELLHTELLDKLTNLTAQYETALGNLESMSTETEEAKNKYQQSASECHRLTNDLSALQQIHEVLSDDIETLMSEKEKLNRTNLQLQQQIQSEEEFHAEELSVCDQKLSVLTDELSAATAASQEAKQKAEILKSKLYSLEQEMKSTVGVGNAIEILKSQILELEADNCSLADSVRSLNTELSEKDERIEATEMEKQEIANQLESDLDSLNRKVKELEQDKVLRGRKHAEIAGKYENLTSEHELLMADHKELSSTLSHLQQELSSINTQYNDLQADYNTLKEQHQTVEQNKVKLINNNEELSSHCDKLNDDMRESENYQRQLEDEIETLKGKLQLDGNKGADGDSNKTSAELQETDEKLKELTQQYGSAKIEWERSMKDRIEDNMELSGRVILLEKAAEQLEGDNKELAKKLQEALNQSSNVDSNLHELQRLKSSNTRLQEQLERQKKYSETLEKEAESLQKKLSQHSQQLQDGYQDKEDEIIGLKTELGKLKLAHDQLATSLQERVKQLSAENNVLQENMASQANEFSSLRSESLKLQASLEEEKFKYKMLESQNSKIESESKLINDRLREANERRMQIELDNQKLSAELRESISVKDDSLLTSMQETDCNKALELADSRISSLEKQRDELRNSLQQVTLELHHTNQSVNDVSELRLDLQAKKDEIIRLKAKIQEAESQRSYEDKKNEELRLSLSSTSQRESALQEQTNDLRLNIFDMESKLSKLQTEKAAIQHELSTTESRNANINQKMSDMKCEKETLEIELMAANEKLQLNIQKYQDRKSRHRNRTRTSRIHYDTEMAKLRDQMEYLNRDVVLLKQALEQEQEHKLQTELKCSTLVTNHRNLLSKQVDLEDEIRERNRGIALLQTKLQYTEQENRQLTDLCNKLKLAPASSLTQGFDVLDTLINKQTRWPSSEIKD